MVIGERSGERAGLITSPHKEITREGNIFIITPIVFLAVCAADPQHYRRSSGHINRVCLADDF